MGYLGNYLSTAVRFSIRYYNFSGWVVTYVVASTPSSISHRAMRINATPLVISLVPLNRRTSRTFPGPSDLG